MTCHVDGIKKRQTLKWQAEGHRDNETKDRTIIESPTNIASELFPINGDGVVSTGHVDCHCEWHGDTKKVIELL